MAKYRKTALVEAWQSFDDCATYTYEYPFWIMDALRDGVIYAKDGKTYVKSLEGDHQVSDGDWILRGIKGELWAIKPNIFAETYEKVD